MNCFLDVWIDGYKQKSAPKFCYENNKLITIRNKVQLPSVSLKVNNEMLHKDNLFRENHKIETHRNVIGLKKLEYRYYAEFFPFPSLSPSSILVITK